jgi:hypothetical protein
VSHGAKSVPCDSHDNAVMQRLMRPISRKQERFNTMAKQSAKAKVVPITGGKGMVTVTTTAKPANVPPPSTKPVATDKKALALVDPRAVSRDVAYDVMSKLVGTFQSKEDLEDQLALNAKHQNGHLGKLTYAFWNAARVDGGIKLQDAFSENAAELKALRLRLEIAAGIKEETIQADGTRIYAHPDKVKQFFNQPGDAKDTPEWTKKDNFRTNFATQFTKCMKTACELFQREYDVNMDKASGMLTISGPAVKEHFQVDAVVLNEKKEGITAKGETVKIEKIPSFTGLAKLAALRNTGKELQTRGDSRIRSGVDKTSGDPGIDTGHQLVAAINSLRNSLRIITSKKEGFGDDVAAALGELQQQITDSLRENRGPKAH